MSFDRDALLEHFGRIWPTHVEKFTGLLITLRRQFGGDLDLMLVLAVIGLRTLPERRVLDLSYADFRAGKLADRQRDPINVQSISDTTGIPRETVRRKVRALEEAGWVERLEQGHLVVSAKARADLAPATEATLSYVVAIVSTCVRAMGLQPGRESQPRP